MILILTLILTGCSFKTNTREDEKYKISDGYSIDFNKWKEIEYNLFQGDKVINEELTNFVSDNTNIELKFEIKQDETGKMPSNWITRLKIHVNDKSHTIYERYGWAIFNVALIDLDENDYEWKKVI